jgi:hypothetical protein
MLNEVMLNEVMLNLFQHQHQHLPSTILSQKAKPLSLSLSFAQEIPPPSSSE